MTDPADTYEALRWLIVMANRHVPELDRPDNALRMHYLRELRDELTRAAGK